MFGLTLEKLVLVAIVAGIVLGPHRLQEYAHTLARTIRGARDLVVRARADAEADLGVPLDRRYWESMDLRQYDPRRIVRDALDERDEMPVTTAAHAASSTLSGPPSAAASDASSAETPDPARAELLEAASRVRPGQKFLVSGDAAHPRRMRISSLPADDPRRIASERPLPEVGGSEQLAAAVEPSRSPDHDLTGRVTVPGSAG